MGIFGTYKVRGLSIPIFPPTTGSVFFVDSGSENAGNNEDSGLNPNAPNATIDYAVSRSDVVANNGDIIIVMPGHSETASTQITCDVAGLSIIGLGVGRSRPLITANATAVDVFNVTAANVHIENLHILGAANCTAFVNIAAQDFSASRCIFNHVATPLVGISVASGGRFDIDDCLFTNSINGADVAIDIEASIVGPWSVTNCRFNYSTYGIDLGVIRANVDTASGGIIDNCIFAGCETVAIDFNSSSTVGGDGVISNCSIGAKGSVANIDTLIDSGGYALIENHGTDSITEAGGLVPVATPA